MITWVWTYWCKIHYNFITNWKIRLQTAPSTLIPRFSRFISRVVLLEKLVLCQRQSHKYFQATSLYCTKLSNPALIHQGDPQRPSLKQSAKAIYNLKRTRQVAQQLRYDFPDIQQEQNVLTGNRTRANAIKSISAAEQRARCYRTFRQLTKTKTSSGIASVLRLEVDNTWKVIQ